MSGDCACSAAFGLLNFNSLFQLSLEFVKKMRRFITTTLTVLLLCEVFVPLLRHSRVAAQDLQQSQNPDAGQSTPVKPATTGQLGGLHIPDGTPIEIEAPYTLSSMDFKPNDKISFRVVNPVKVNGITVIDHGATATGRIDKAKRGGHWGKAGLLVWTMQTVTAVDGSKIPLRVASVRLRGDSKAAKVATQMIITGALLPLIAPVALLHGFKRGENAYIPAGKRYDVYVDGNPMVIPGPALVR